MPFDVAKLEGTIRPHKGPQTDFLRSAADIAIFGGAAGGGKTWGLLLEPLRHVMTRRDFYAVAFRRNTVQVRNPGGMWDQSMRLYPDMEGIPRTGSLEWYWKGGGRIKFAHLELEVSKLDWQGSEIALILWDELTHFTEGQFWYLLSRNRSMSGVKGYVRATTNPDADSWVRKLIEWFIDPTSGLPIRERAGHLRWFIRVDEQLVWSDDPESLKASYPWAVPKSLTFIPSTLDDNPTLNRLDPGYRANLMAMPMVERERLLGGNWNVRPSAGLYFNRNWVRVIDEVPKCTVIARGWDLAATPETPGLDPDWTCSTLIGQTYDDQFVVLDHTFMRGSPGDVERAIMNTASRDGLGVIVSLPQDPGQAGKSQIEMMVHKLKGYPLHHSPESGDKITRFSPFSAQAEFNHVLVLRGHWNERWFNQLEGFPMAPHDDDVDSTSRAFAQVAQSDLNFWARM